MLWTKEEEVHLDVDNIRSDDDIQVSHLEAHGVSVELAHVGTAVLQLGIS